MTNCYICGHPILYGQKSRGIADAEHAAQGGDIWTERAHLNPMDHLPTLDAGEQFAELVQRIETKERERAARLVEEAVMYEMGGRIRLNGDLTMTDLAHRIREGG